MIRACVRRFAGTHRGSGSRAASSATAGPDPSTLDFFRQVVGDSNVLVRADELQKYNVDWLGIFHGGAKAVVRPRTTLETASILKHCNDARIGVVPLGGNTGLVGGGVARDAGEIVLSLERMKDVLSFDEESAVVVCEAGCVLADADSFLKAAGFTMPIDLA